MDFIFDWLAIGDLADAESHPTVDAILNPNQFHYYMTLHLSAHLFSRLAWLNC